jgi:lambda family phage portal protein
MPNAAGYEGARDSRNRTHYAFRRSPEGDEDNVIGRHDRQSLQLELRYMYRNNPIVKGVVDRMVSYATCGSGMPQAQTSDRKWNEQAEAWWRQVYVPTADYRQRQGVTLSTMQGWNMSERMLTGDIGYIMLANGQLQSIEASRIMTPQPLQKDKKIVDGVKISASGLVQGYFIVPRKANGQLDQTKYKFVPRENFIHCWKPTRPDMVRGIPDLAALVNPLRDYNTTDENIRAKIKADAMTWAISKRETGPMNMRNRDAYKLDEGSDVNPQRVEKLESMQLIHAGIKEDLLPFDSKTPNSENIKYVEHLLQVMAQALDVPYEFMMLMATTGSYSAIREAMIMAHHAIMKWSAWDDQVFNRRVWNWRIAKAIKSGELPPAPTDDNGQSEWWRVEWSLPAWQEIDADKQAKGEAAAYRMGKTSLKNIIAMTGRDRHDVFIEKAQDIADAERVAEELLGDKARWREIIDVTNGQTMPATTPTEE